MAALQNFIGQMELPSLVPGGFWRQLANEGSGDFRHLTVVAVDEEAVAHFFVELVVLLSANRQ